jgi:hypothetical protein
MARFIAIITRSGSPVILRLIGVKLLFPYCFHFFQLLLLPSLLLAPSCWCSFTAHHLVLVFLFYSCLMHLIETTWLLVMLLCRGLGQEELLITSLEETAWSCRSWIRDTSRSCVNLVTSLPNSVPCLRLTIRVSLLLRINRRLSCLRMERLTASVPISVYASPGLTTVLLIGCPFLSVLFIVFNCTRCFLLLSAYYALVINRPPVG